MWNKIDYVQKSTPYDRVWYDVKDEPWTLRLNKQLETQQSTNGKMAERSKAPG